MATEHMSFSEKLQASYENLGESGQLDLYYQHGAGTYNQRPHINPLTNANEKHSPAFSLMRPNGGIRVRCHDFKSDKTYDLYDFLKETQGEGYARAVLGLNDDYVKPVPSKKTPPPAPLPRKSATIKKAEKLYRRSTEADQKVKDYLKSRSITTPLPPSIRSDGNTMLSIVTDADGNFQAVHQTALWETPDGKHKKLMFGPVGGGSVHLGEPVDGKLAICEGIEDGLSILQATGLPVWAALSAGGIKKLILPDSITEVLIFCDSDQVKHGNPDHPTSIVGQKAALVLAERLTNEGITVTIVFPVEQTSTPEKKDFNDLLVQDQTGQIIRNRLEIAVPYQPEVTPTAINVHEYPEIGVPVSDAKAPLKKVIADFFVEVKQPQNNSVEKTNEILQVGVQVDTAGGKSEEALKHVSQAIDDGLSGVIAVPQHKLSRDLHMRLSALTDPNNVNVWLGYEQPDPLAPRETMCRFPETITNIKKALGNIEDFCGSAKSPCPFKPGKNGESTHGDVCGYWRQRRDKNRKVWIIPSNMLSGDRPANIPNLDFLVIDEDFTHFMLNGTGGRYAITRADLLEPRTFPAREGFSPVMTETFANVALSRIQIYIDKLEHGHFSKDDLLDGNFLEACQKMEKLEWLLKKEIPKNIREMGDKEREETLESIATYNNVITKRVRFWKNLSAFLVGEEGKTPYLHWNGVDIRLAWKDEIHVKWKVPTLYMDATLNETIIRYWLPNLEVKARIKIEPTHVHRIQVSDMPFSQSAFVPNVNYKNHYQTQCNNAERFDRVQEVIAAQHRNKGDGNYDILTIAQKSLIEHTQEKHKTNPTWDTSCVGFEWQNNLRGIDKYKGISAEIVVGRILPRPEAIEFQTSIITGRVIEPIKGWYPKREKGIRMADGSVVPVMGEYHPDPDAEAVRWQICEGELIQAEGRGRGNRRTAKNPLTVYICTNVCLPLTVHEVVSYKDLMAMGTGVRLMAARGLIPDDWKGTAAVLNYGQVEDATKEAHACKVWFGRHPDEMARLGAFRESLNVSHLPKGSLLGECDTFNLDWVRVRYRLPDTRKSTSAWIDSTVDPVTHLKRFLGEGITILSIGKSVRSASMDVPIPPPTTEDSITLTDKQTVQLVGGCIECGETYEKMETDFIQLTGEAWAHQVCLDEWQDRKVHVG